MPPILRAAPPTSASPRGRSAIDFAAVMARKDRVVGDKRAGLDSWLRDMTNCTVIDGHARFVSPHAVEVGGDTLEADEIFINVGGRAVIPDFPGVDQVRTLTNTTLLELDRLPRHLVDRRRQLYRARVRPDFPAARRRGHGDRKGAAPGRPRGPEDVSDAIQAILEAEGIAIRLRRRMHPLRAHAEPISRSASIAQRRARRCRLACAACRRPAAEHRRSRASTRRASRSTRAAISSVDDELQTSVPHIWALGDCNGRGAFTHTAYNDFEIAAANLFDGAAAQGERPHSRLCALFDPPLGRVGMTETEARRKASRPRRHGGR